MEKERPLCDTSREFEVDEVVGRRGKGSIQAEDEGAETDERRLEQRQKQVDFGKNTLGYQRYVGWGRRGVNGQGIGHGRACARGGDRASLGAFT